MALKSLKEWTKSIENLKLIIKNNKNNKGEIKMAKNIRKILLESGVEIKGTYERVKLWLPEVEEFSGIKDFTLSDKVNVTIDLETFHEGKVLDIENLYFETDIRVAVGVSKTEVYTDTGKIMSIRDLFGIPFKYGNSNIKDKFVRIQNCFSGDTLVSLGGIMLRSSIRSDVGYVQSVSERDGVATVKIGDKSLRLPAYCCLDISNDIFSEKMKLVNGFFKDNGSSPEIDGSMLGLDISECGDYIEYISDKRLDRMGGDLYNKELRTKFATKKKIRGALQSIYPSVSSSLMEDAIMLYCSKSVDVEILTGKDMLQVFISDNCSSNGSIGSSCMRNKSPRYFKIYEDSADGVAVIKDVNGKIILRAILWTLRKADGQTQKFMDRIYSGNTAYETKLKSWAIQNGYAYLNQQTHSCRKAKLPNGEEMHFRGWFVPTKKEKYESLPYIDTFSTFVGGFLFYREQHIVECKSTSGGYSSTIHGDSY